MLLHLLELIGLMDPVDVWLGRESHVAHLSLLGYDWRVDYRGRGASESMGAWLAMSPGVIAFKNIRQYDRRADRNFEEEEQILCATLDGMKLQSFPRYEVRVRCATEHRCGVVVKGPRLYILDLTQTTEGQPFGSRRQCPG